QKQVRRIEKNFHEAEATLFSAGQNADTFVDRFALKKKRTKQGSNAGFRVSAARVGGFFENRSLHLKHLRAMLREISRLNVEAGFSVARLKGENSREHFEQR